MTEWKMEMAEVHLSARRSILTLLVLLFIQELFLKRKDFKRDGKSTAI